ncbi:flagellar basal-body MS-ring/collar protein FliF [Lacisediminihabitans sp.]|jgi:flagellar M-ring protein FliF|uniref:flagellar basal-body MS-ring/collar protein FliF n=1 Tax=Lacisediminihabitans sp. TaxID=2787631 RepID=UPI002F958A9F
MPTQVSTALRRLAHTIREFTIAQRTVAIIGVAVLALGVVALSFWITKPAYTPLFSGLSGTDANTIVEQLRTDGVQYEITNGGGTIMVPEANVYDERLKAAAAGLPSSTTGGYSLLDKMGVTASEFQQNVTYKRALEGELANTIEAMKGVKTASVQLAIPKDTVFVSEKTDPTASVFIATDNGVTLTDEQVQAIVHLTSASIDGMKATDVSVIDAQGIVLSAAGVTSGAEGKVASDYESRVRSSVQAMLDKVVGPGNATVVVAADLSQNSGQRTEESFTSPTDAPSLNESFSSDSSGGAAGATGSSTGVLGPDNIAVPSGVQTGSGVTSQSVTKNNAINKVTESTTIPAGAITRQTVSVALNSSVASGLNIANIKALINAAAGIDKTRGDQVAVEVVSFNKVGAVQAAKALAAADAAATADRTAGIIRTAITIFGIAIPATVALFLIARRLRRRNEEEQELRDMGELAEMRAMMNDQTVPIALTAPAAAPLTYTQLPPVAPGDNDRKRAEIDALAGKDPQRTADFLRGLMDDRQPA